MNYKSLNSAIRSVTNPQPKNEALTSLQENIDLYNAVLPYTIGLQSVITLVMIEALLDGSGPISGTVSLFKNLMKKWKARVLGGQLSADEGQSFIAEYEKLAASLPTGKRNFLKASLNKMEQAAKAGDKGKLGAIATEVKNYLARNSAEVKEDYQTPDRAAQSRNIVGDAVDRANNSETDRQDKIRNRKLTKVSNRHEMERKSKKTYGMGGKIVKKSTVKEEQEYIERLEFALESIAEELECDVEDLLEDLQTRGRYLQVDRKATHSERLADIKGRKERKSKKVYGMHGKELAPSAAAYFKKHPTASRLLHNPSTAGD